MSSSEIRGCELPHAISLERCPHPHSQSPRSAREPIITVTQPEITHWPFLPNCPNILSAHAPQTLAEEQGPTWLQDPPKSIQNPSPRPQLQRPLVPQGPWGQLSRLHSMHNVHPTWARKKVGVQSCPREPRPEVGYQSSTTHALASGPSFQKTSWLQQWLNLQSTPRCPGGLASVYIPRLPLHFARGHSHATSPGGPPCSLWSMS